MRTMICAIVLIPSIAMAADDKKPYDQMIGLEMEGRGKVSKFWNNELTEGANAMLHGYVPRAGDVVEFYIRQADCEVPDVKCNFEIAIRKKAQP